MRRLTEFEKKVVKIISFLPFKLNSPRLRRIKLDDLLLNFVEEGVYFSIKKNNLTNNYDVVGHYNNKKDIPEAYDVMSDKEVVLKIINGYKILLDLLHVLDILVENKLISYSMLIPLQIIEQQIGKDSEINIGYNKIRGVSLNLGVDVLTDDDLLNKILRFYFPTEALTVFINNGYRTEEQKLADETDFHNRITRKVSWWAVGAAIAAVVVSAIFSALSYYDSKYGETENKAFKEEILYKLKKIDEKTN